MFVRLRNWLSWFVSSIHTLPSSRFPLFLLFYPLPDSRSPLRSPHLGLLSQTAKPPIRGLSWYVGTYLNRKLAKAKSDQLSNWAARNLTTRQLTCKSRYYISFVSKSLSSSPRPTRSNCFSLRVPFPFSSLQTPPTTPTAPHASSSPSSPSPTHLLNTNSPTLPMKRSTMLHPGSDAVGRGRSDSIEIRSRRSSSM